MKQKKILIPNYSFKDDLGTFEFHGIEILIDSNSEITPETFNQELDDYSISSNEIDKMGRESGRRFFNEKYKRILNEEWALTPREINGIRLFLNVNGTDLAKLLHLDKSSISRILSGKQDLQKDTMVLLMEIMGKEIEIPGIIQEILERLSQDKEELVREDVNLPAELVTEWIIRKFIELEECVTNLKLQKLLYYAQGIGYGRYNCKLIRDNFVKWEHGPVVPSIYHAYKGFNADPLPKNQSIDIRAVTSNDLVVKILTETINKYGKYSAWVLRDKTHSEEPWLATPCDKTIPDDLIKNFFKGVLY